MSPAINFHVSFPTPEESWQSETFLQLPQIAILFNTSKEKKLEKLHLD